MRYKEEIRDTLWLVLLQGVGYAVPLLVLPYLMKVLGPGRFGCYSFGVAVAQYLLLIVDFGFNLTATRRIAVARDNPLEEDRIFSAVMKAKLGLLALSLLLGAGIGLLPAYRSFLPVTLVSMLTVVGQCFTFTWLYQGLGRIRWLSLINALCKILLLPLAFLLVKGPDDCLVAAALQSGVYLLAAVVSTALAFARRYARWQRTAWSDTLPFLKEGFPLFLSTAATSIYTSLFVVLLASFAPDDEVGRYAAAEKVMRACTYLLWIPLSQAFFPRVSRLAATAPADARQLVIRLLAGSSCLMLAVGLFLWFGATPLVAWLGKGYDGMQTAMRILAFVPWLVTTGGICGQMGLIAGGGNTGSRYFMRVYLAAGAIALAAVLTLGVRYGAVGTACSVLLAELFVTVMMLIGWLRLMRSHR